jgi:hypothetical protein
VASGLIGGFSVKREYTNTSHTSIQYIYEVEVELLPIRFAFKCYKSFRLQKSASKDKQ